MLHLYNLRKFGAQFRDSVQNSHDLEIKSPVSIGSFHLHDQVVIHFSISLTATHSCIRVNFENGSKCFEDSAFYYCRRETRTTFI